MKKGLTEIVFILDRSGSMYGLEADTIGGYNSFLDKQKAGEGEAYVSMVLFNDNSVVIHDRVNINKIEHLTEKEYEPSGCTALLDAIGNSIRHIKNVHKYIREEDVPEKTIFVITTDGMENASTEYTYKNIKKMIKDLKEKRNWDFLFLGANIDAISEAEKIGISSNRAVKYKCDNIGTRKNFEVVSETICCMRADRDISDIWKKDIEDYEKDGE